MEHYGVVILEHGRCTFASAVLTLPDAETLAAKLGPPATVVDVALLRILRRTMLEKP